jgi:hypothetical protein
MTHEEYAERVRRQRIIEEARSTVERLKDLEEKRDDAARLPPADLARRLIPAAADDAVARWRADANAFARERRREKRRLRMETHRAPDDEIVRRRHEESTAAKQPDWSAIDARIEAYLARERKLLCETLGEEVGRLLAEERTDTMRKLREEIRELRLEYARLGSQTEELRAALDRERGGGAAVVSARH